MKRTTKWILGGTLLGTAIYALAPNAFNAVPSFGFWAVRGDIVLLSGTIALVLMTLVVLIAIRADWVDRFMGGLDKGYVVHKWAGVWATIAATIHLLTEKVPKWTYGWGIYPERVRSGSAAAMPPEWQVHLWRSGNVAVEFTIYVVIALVIIALIHRIPYRYFRYTHKLFPALYLLVAYHSITILYKAGWMAQPAGHLVVAISVVGSLAALIALFQMIGATRTARGVITDIDRYENGVLDLHVRTTDGHRMVHTPGQFGYLRIASYPEPHPFTFASSGDDPTRLRFGIKALGHYTTRLAERVSVGDRVKIEGPYGCFHFDHPSVRQVWIAGGIGVTPFLSRLENLVHTGGTKVPVDFWYCVADARNAAYPNGLGALCEQAGVTLHLMLADKGEFLTADTIAETTGGLEGVNILFCGPGGFARSLLEGLKAHKFNERDFHYDNFGMR